MDDLPFELQVPTEVETGVYANGVSIWWTAHDFSLDFGAILPTLLVETDEGPKSQNRARVVARVKIPPAQVFELIKGLNEALTGYEQQYGTVSGGAPEDPPLYPPPGLTDTD